MIGPDAKTNCELLDLDTTVPVTMKKNNQISTPCLANHRLQPKKTKIEKLVINFQTGDKNYI
jgi:hypothetical protein